MTITCTDTITFRYGRVTNRNAYGCVFNYTNSRKEKTVVFRSDIFRQPHEYDAVLLAVKQAEAYIRSVPDGDARLADRIWRQYLDTKQMRLFEEQKEARHEARLRKTAV